MIIGHFLTGSSGNGQQSITTPSFLCRRDARRFNLTVMQRRLKKMTYNDNHNLDIDPAMIILGLGYATCLIVGITWVASLVI